MLGILSMSILGNQKTFQQFSNLISHEVQIAEHSKNIDIYLLQCRRDEKDFLLRDDTKYVDKHAKSIDMLKEEVNAILNLTKGIDEKMYQEANKILLSLDRYHKDFSAVVDEKKRIGLDNLSGLQGQLRKSAHVLSADLAQHQIDPLYLAFYQMRIFEREYARIKSEKMKEKLSSSIALFSTMATEMEFDPAAKKVVMAELQKYKDAFSSQSGEFIESMAATSGAIEKAFDEIFVPGIRPMILTIRKHEKDYFLREDKKYVDKAMTAAAGLLQSLDISYKPPIYVK